MTSLVVRAAMRCVRGWTRLYTSRLPPAARTRRCAEIASDLWEAQHRTAGAHEFRDAAHILLRLVMGMPDDLGWRLEQAAVVDTVGQSGLAWSGRVAGAAFVLAALWVIDIDASRKHPIRTVLYSRSGSGTSTEAASPRSNLATDGLDHGRTSFAHFPTIRMRPTQAPAGRPRPIVIDDFESGTLSGWSLTVNGEGGWFIYTKGTTPPDPSKSDPNVPFNVPDPPQGRFAVVSDMNGPGMRILSRDVRLDGRYVLHLILFYVSGADDFYSANTLRSDFEDNQQFRIDIVRTTAAADSLANGDVLANVFHTSPGDPRTRAPADVAFDLSRWQGQTVRLRLASADNHGPLRVGVDEIRLEPVGQ